MTRRFGSTATTRLTSGCSIMSATAFRPCCSLMTSQRLMARQRASPRRGRRRTVSGTTGRHHTGIESGPGILTLQDVKGRFAQRYDARDGTVYLARPDQHVARAGARSIWQHSRRRAARDVQRLNHWSMTVTLQLTPNFHQPDHRYHRDFRRAMTLPIADRHPPWI